MNIPQLRKQIDVKLAEYNHVCRQVKEEVQTLRAARTHVENAAKAQKVMQEVAESVQRKAHERISGIVTRCLQTVFGEDTYQFRIEFVQKRGRTEAELVFEKNGVVINDALESMGGGICDLISFCLRLASLTFAVPRKRRLLVMDEPWKHLSAQYRPVVVDLIKALATEMKMQFIIVTHSDEFASMGQLVEL